MNACEWTQADGGDEDYYLTSCGKAHWFGDGDITENSYKYCPYCGGVIVETTPAGAGKEE